MHTLAMTLCILLLDLIKIVFLAVWTDFSEFLRELHWVLACDSEEELILFKGFRSGLL